MTESSLFEQLKHKNPNLRERAIWQIAETHAETHDETTIPRLMGVLAEEDTVYRRAAVKALGAIGTDTVPSLVDSLLNSDNSTIRSSCAKALAQYLFVAFFFQSSLIDVILR
ncbi:HEAT repeat domain-containing protein [Hydrocoleum sp. CS-953]|uniref:HEAT repeat domain-containing protein n=1 Tax=Hydrocoleum sp. CS-953 TaxID=1671698 RepID=UPI000B9B19FB|nr:HEAT repeat domain-containing protein [Hydrocoleum sp. CS-953]